MLHYLIPAPSVLLTETGKSCIKAIFKKMTLLQSTVQINIMCSLHLHRIHTYATFSFKSSNTFRQWKTIRILRKPVRNNPYQHLCISININIGKSYFQNSTVMHKNLFIFSNSTAGNLQYCI